MCNGEKEFQESFILKLIVLWGYGALLSSPQVCWISTRNSTRYHEAFWRMQRKSFAPKNFLCNCINEESHRLNKSLENDSKCVQAGQYPVVQEMTGVGFTAEALCMKGVRVFPFPDLMPAWTISRGTRETRIIVVLVKYRNSKYWKGVWKKIR